MSQTPPSKEPNKWLNQESIFDLCPLRLQTLKSQPFDDTICQPLTKHIRINIFWVLSQSWLFWPDRCNAFLRPGLLGHPLARSLQIQTTPRILKVNRLKWWCNWCEGWNTQTECECVANKGIISWVVGAVVQHCSSLALAQQCRLECLCVRTHNVLEIQKFAFELHGWTIMRQCAQQHKTPQPRQITWWFQARTLTGHGRIPRLQIASCLWCFVKSL